MRRTPHPGMGMLEKNGVIERNGSLPDELARRLRQSIEAGELRPGEQLPTQHELCATYGVSRSVVREALSLLKSEGLVTSQQGRGQFVSPEGNRVFRLQPNLQDSHELDLVLEFLMSVEVVATQLAAARRTDDELAEIRGALDALAQAIKAGGNGVNEDMQFHSAILKASHNPYVQQFGEYLESQVRRLIRIARTNTARHAGLTAAVHKEHEAIYKAIAERDEAQAREAAAQHLTNAGARLRLYQVSPSAEP